MSTQVTVRNLEIDDRIGWELLWAGYQSHLRTKVPDSAVEETWRKLVDPGVDVFGIVAMVNEFRMAGLAHYSFSPSSWSRGPLCHLQDLYVGKEFRGAAVGKSLIDGVFAMADKARASQVFWHLSRSDFRAKLLFDNYNAGPESQIVQVRRKLSR